MIRTIVRSVSSLSGKLAVITGGTRGIGFATTERFLELGADVVVWGVSPGIEESLSRIEVPEGQVLHPMIVNVAETQDVDDAIEQIETEIGPIDVLIANSGITWDGMMWKMTEEAFDSVIDINLKGVFNCGTSVARRMIEREEGVILSTSSITGVYGNIGQTNYAATKWGIIGMTKTWAKELGRKGIRVNCVAPGYTMTEMMETVPEEILDGIAAQTPLGRLGEPIEIANAFAFLASDEASFITGQVLQVDGGLVV